MNNPKKHEATLSLYLQDDKVHFECAGDAKRVQLLASYATARIMAETIAKTNSQGSIKEKTLANEVYHQIQDLVQVILKEKYGM